MKMISCNLVLNQNSSQDLEGYSDTIIFNSEHVFIFVRRVNTRSDLVFLCFS